MDENTSAERKASCCSVDLQVTKRFGLIHEACSILCLHALELQKFLSYSIAWQVANRLGSCVEHAEAHTQRLACKCQKRKSGW